MELTKHALLDRMIGDPESPESPESPQVVSPESPKDQHQKAQESYLTERAAMWLSFGYSREECIDFVTGEGYSKPFAVKIVDQAFGRISETEGNTEIQ